MLSAFVNDSSGTLSGRLGSALPGANFGKIGWGDPIARLSNGGSTIGEYASINDAIFSAPTNGSSSTIEILVQTIDIFYAIDSFQSNQNITLRTSSELSAQDKTTTLLRSANGAPGSSPYMDAIITNNEKGTNNLHLTLADLIIDGYSAIVTCNSMYSSLIYFVGGESGSTPNILDLGTSNTDDYVNLQNNKIVNNGEGNVIFASALYFDGNGTVNINNAAIHDNYAEEADG
ncbi:MAG: hypothetical protein HUJ62_02875, partial [Streptococcus gallolyticus]|nr:hypothetical protein [Streptococcus gallolyticus]